MVRKVKAFVQGILAKVRSKNSGAKQKVVGKEPVVMPAPPFSYSGPVSVRRRAIWRALRFGLMPWWLYESEKHHEGSWLHHSAVNVYYAARWAFGCETAEDRKFERETNG